MIAKTGGYAKRLITGDRVMRLGDYGDAMPVGSTDYTRLNLICIEDIGSGVVQFRLVYVREDGQEGYEEHCTFGGTFWIDWQEG